MKLFSGVLRKRNTLSENVTHNCPGDVLHYSEIDQAVSYIPSASTLWPPQEQGKGVIQQQPPSSGTALNPVGTQLSFDEWRTVRTTSRALPIQQTIGRQSSPHHLVLWAQPSASELCLSLLLDSSLLIQSKNVLSPVPDKHDLLSWPLSKGA